jgi:hypothetical protein
MWRFDDGQRDLRRMIAAVMAASPFALVPRSVGGIPGAARDSSTGSE